MNKLKIAAAFILGAGAGAFGSMKFFETKYQAIAEEEIQAFIDLRKKEDTNETAGMTPILNDEGKVVAYIGDPQEVIDSLDADAFKEAAKEINIISEEKAKEEKTFASQNTVDLNKTNYERIAETDHPRDDEPEEPFRISEETYSETELGFDKIMLHYYMDDDIMFNVNEGAIETSLTIGDEGMNIVRQSNSTELYFRNYTYGCDYEVIKIAGSYYIDMG